MIENRIHFKSTIFVKVKGGVSIDSLIDMVSRWALGKVGTNANKDEGGLKATSLKKFEQGSIETLFIQKEDEDCDLWALRLIHQDKTIAYRNWQVDVIVKNCGDHRYRVDVFVFHFLTQDYVGAEPYTPPATTPTIVIAILESTHFWVPYYGNDPLTSLSTKVADSSFNTFLDRFLLAPDRALPIVYFSLRRGKEFEIQAVAARLAILLAGTCLVFVATDFMVDDLIEAKLGKEYRCCRGMVRIYSPGIQVKNAEDYKRHRFFVWHYINTVGYDSLVNTLVASLVRRNAFKADRDQLNFDEIVRRLDHERLVRASNENQQWNELYESDNKALTDQISKFKREIEELNEMYEATDQQLSERNFELGQLKERTDHLQKLLKEKTTESPIVTMFSELPSSILQNVQMIQRIWETRIFFTQEALDSAKVASYKDINKAWSCLWRMAEVLHPLFFGDEKSAKEIETEYKSRTGFDYSVSDSSQTKASKDLVKKRSIIHDSVEYEMMSHIKLGNSPTNSLRVYFVVDRSSQRLIVGHCGDHIESAGTKRKGIK